MSLPSELRTICHLLSSTEPSHLPYITPILLRNVLCCEEVLSASDENGKSSDTSEHLVLVHKFKTQLTTLLNGKTPGGRFAAVVLVKAVVELGGWEILRGSEPWVKGLLLVLAKPDTTEIKSICVLALVSIYVSTHQYQTLVREITTPTLPAFVTSCLNLVPKSTPTPGKNLNGRESLTESVFEAFSALIPRHPTIFRPFSFQIQVATRLYLAPTISDQCFVTPSLQQSACRLAVVIHQTAAKNSAGDEWAKALQRHIKAVHQTADQVFRAVVEDWESMSGYVSKQIDVNAPICGGSESAEDFPEWSGIFAGVERLTGILVLVTQYLRSSTTAAVSIPVGAIMDLVTRILSLAKPTGSTRESGSARVNPAVDRDEREGLWAGLPQIHIASMKLLMSMMDRLQAGFLPLSQGCLDQITWLFPFGHSNEEFRTIAYLLSSKLLCCGGSMLPKDSVSKLSLIIFACCKDLLPALAKGQNTLLAQKEGAKKVDANGINADTFLHATTNFHKQSPGLNAAANELLPLFLSHLPQAHLGFPLRSLVDRIAIMTQHKDAMITSFLSPFPANRHALPSILPYVSRQFPDALAIEALLRPRFPLLPSRQSDLPSLDTDLECAEQSTIEDHMELDAYNGLTRSLTASSQERSTVAIEKLTPSSTVPTPSLSEIKPSVPTIAENSWGNMSNDVSSAIATEKTALSKRPLSESSAITSTSAPVSKRGRFRVDYSQNEVQALSANSTEINETPPISHQNASGDIEQDSDDESVPSLKMEFDSSEEE